MRGIAVGLLLAAAGVAAGYFWGSSATSGREPLHDQRPPAAAEPSVPAPQGDAVEATAGGASDLSRALGALPRPHAERGTGKITGRVRTANGAPVPGATITAGRIVARESTDWRPGDPEPKQGSLEDAVKECVRDYFEQEVTTVRAFSRADGTYALEELVPGTYVMRAYKKGYSIQPTLQRWQAKPGCVFDFSARVIVDVPIEVLLPDGSSARKASIEYHSASSNADYSGFWKASQPSLRVPPGTCTLQASVQEPLPLRSKEVRIEVPRAGMKTSVVLQLVDKPGIRGNVKLPPGAKCSWLEVCALAVVAGTEFDAGRVQREGKSVSDPVQNTYWIRDIPPGHYQIGVFLSSTLVAKSEVDVGKGTARCDFSLEHLDPSRYFLLHVFGPDGETPAQVRVAGAYRRKGETPFATSGWIRLVDGTFRVLVPGPPPEGSTGAYLLRVAAEDYGTKVIEYRRGKDRELTVRFREPAFLHVAVSGDSTVLAQLSASLVPWTEESSPTSGTPLDSEGGVTFGPVEPGSFAVALLAGRLFGGVQVLRQRVDLTSGKNRLKLEAPAFGSLTVIADGLPAGTSVTLLREGAPHWSVAAGKVGEDGRAVFASLPDGLYHLEGGAGSKHGKMDVEVSGATAVTFRPK